MKTDQDVLGRRSLLAAAAAAAALTACGRTRPDDATRTADRSSPGARVLLAYFSRAGENYYYGDRIDLQVGNTEVLASMISTMIGCDLHRIEAAAPYSADYDDTVARNVAEQQADARPALATTPPAVEDYDVILLASGLWNVRPPMIMQTFAESLDLRGKTVLPVVTHAVSGMGSAPSVYARACPGATVGDGIAVRGEEVARARDQVWTWLHDAEPLPAA